MRLTFQNLKLLPKKERLLASAQDTQLGEMGKKVHGFDCL